MLSIRMGELKVPHLIGRIGFMGSMGRIGRIGFIGGILRAVDSFNSSSLAPVI